MEAASGWIRWNYQARSERQAEEEGAFVRPIHDHSVLEGRFVRVIKIQIWIHLIFICYCYFSIVFLVILSLFICTVIIIRTVGSHLETEIDEMGAQEVLHRSGQQATTSSGAAAGAKKLYASRRASFAKSDNERMIWLHEMKEVKSILIFITIIIVIMIIINW